MKELSLEYAASMAVSDIARRVKQKVIKKGFGNLVISQTAAYGCRLLFRELKDYLV
ncbi:hypothetical protein [Nostoc sp.]|uniref:hypothetical protein n=1 Tax=Nostoc sp. TaxID=1180 RepID=UPI002FF36D9A